MIHDMQINLEFLSFRLGARHITLIAKRNELKKPARRIADIDKAYNSCC